MTAYISWRSRNFVMSIVSRPTLGQCELRRRVPSYRLIAFLVIIGWATSAQGSPLTLQCTGTLTLEGNETEINGDSAILDLENRAFKPPLYSAFPVTGMDDNEIIFGSELSNFSSWGRLDRIGQSNDERDDTKRTQSAHCRRLPEIPRLDARCAPARRMF